MRVPFKDSTQSLPMVPHVIITQICADPPKYKYLEVEGFSKLDVLERISGKKYAEHSILTVNAVQICVRHSLTGLPVRVMTKANGMAFMAHGDRAQLSLDGEPESAGRVDHSCHPVDAEHSAPKPQYHPGEKKGRHKWGGEFDHFIGAPKMGPEQYREWLKAPTVKPWRARRCEKCKAMKMESPGKDKNGFRQTLYISFPTPRTITHQTRYVRLAPECTPEITDRSLDWFEAFCEENNRMPENTDYENALF